MTAQIDILKLIHSSMDLQEREDLILELLIQFQIATDNDKLLSIIGDFEKEFRDYGREGNFSYEGLRALFDYLEQYETDCNTEIELNVIAICCDYTEDSIQNIADNYGIEGDREEILETLMYNTQVIEVDEDNIIIQDY